MATDVPQDSQQQGTHHFVLTLGTTGVGDVTVSGHVTPTPGSTRFDLFNDVVKRTNELHPVSADWNVIFFSLEPNQL